VLGRAREARRMKKTMDGIVLLDVQCIERSTSNSQATLQVHRWTRPKGSLYGRVDR
ncbi:hypothetical protein Dimus_006362, partial [Dionaea muscipula]